MENCGTLSARAAPPEGKIAPVDSNVMLATISRGSRFIGCGYDICFLIFF